MSWFSNLSDLLLTNHSDLKPLNCIFDSDQEMLKVADFGESRLFRKNEVVKHERPDFFPSADLTLQMTTNIGSACWAVSVFVASCCDPCLALQYLTLF